MPARAPSPAARPTPPAAAPLPSSPLILYVLYPALLLLAIAWCAIRPLSDPDTWFHMALGRHILEHGTLPRADIFSHTSPGNEWISSGWLASVLLEGLFKAGGESGAGLVAMVFAVIAAAYLTIYASALRFHDSRGEGALIVLPLLAATMAAAQRFHPRPDIWTQLFVALAAVILLTAERRLDAEDNQWLRTGRFPRRLWLLPPLFALWANLHAGYLAGFFLIAAFGVHLIIVRVRAGGATTRAGLIAIPLLLCFATWMLNPYGPRLAELARKIAAIPQVSLVYEWMPLLYYPSFAAPLPVYLGFALLLLFVGVAWTRARGLRLWHAGVIILFAALALLQRRQVSLAAIVIPVFLIPYAPLLAGPVLRLRWVSPACALLLTTGILGLQFLGAYGNEGGGPKVGRTEDLPVFAAEFLKSHRPPGRMYNSYNLGAYLLYELGPETKVFIDGRLDVYDHQVWLDSLAVEDGTLPLQTFLARYAIDTFVIQIADAYGDPRHLATRLDKSPEWRLVHFDDRNGVFVRATRETEAYLQENAFRYVTPFEPERLAQALADPVRRQAAVNEMRRALTQSGGSGVAMALGALTAAAGGDSDSAARFLATALERAPQSPPVQAIAARLTESGGR